MHTKNRQGLLLCRPKLNPCLRGVPNLNPIVVTCIIGNIRVLLSSMRTSKH